MDDFVVVDDLDAPDYLVEDADGLFEGEYFVGELALKIVEVADVAIFHDEEVPVSFWVGRGLHSKVR